MSGPTVDWATPRAPGTGAGEDESLRERKKRLMRQQLSDAATLMFMERGFDAVRVAEVAAACGVSEKTVFNYFPTKESLILDRLEGTMAALRAGLADRGVAPVEAVLRILDGELTAMTSWLAGADDPVGAAAAMRRFGALIQASPSLRAHQSDMMDQFVAVAAEILAERSGLASDDPEPQITATALLGLWRIQFLSLSKHLDGALTAAQVYRAVTGDVLRAARLIRAGLDATGGPSPGEAVGMSVGTLFPKSPAALEGWLRELEAGFDDRALPVTLSVACAWGRQQQGRPLPVIDALIAATARVHGMTVVTRNVKDFEQAGVQVLNPFEPVRPGHRTRPLIAAIACSYECGCTGLAA